MTDEENDPAVSVFFRVAIDDVDLGSFTACEGLSFSVKIEPVVEGGNNGFVHQLPGHIEYKNVKFTRPINADSAKLARWFATMDGPIKRTNCQISAMSFKGDKTIAKWVLKGVIPVSWTGPSFNAGSPSVLTESFEIAHHGFLEGSP